MIEQAFIELMHKEIDGENSPEESKRLRKHLEENSEARSLFDEMIAFNQILKQVKDVSPPTDLKAGIMQSLSPHPYPAYTSIKAFGSLRSMFSFNYRYGFSFAAGLILGMVSLFFIFRSGFSDESTDFSHLLGTISPENSQNLNVTKQEPFVLDEASGEVWIKQSRTFVMAEIVIQSRESIEMVIQYDSSELYFNGFFQRGDNPSRHFQMDKNRVRISTMGDNRYAILFHRNRRQMNDVTLKLYHTDKLIFEQSLVSMNESR